MMMCFDIGFSVDFGQYIVQATFTSFTLNLAIVAPVREFLTFGAAVRAPGARTRPNGAPSTWCGSFMTKDRN